MIKILQIKNIIQIQLSFLYVDVYFSHKILRILNQFHNIIDY